MSHVTEKFSKDLVWDVTGFGVVIAESSHQLTQGQINSLSLTMGLVFGIMLLLFLSWKAGLIAILPNIFPIIVNFGIMGWLGVDLSMATALIASIAIGLAVDDTIHYLVRFNREFREDLDEKRALREAIRKVGRPIMFTTLTISAGFLILTLSSFKLTAVFGAMLVITMLSALVGDLILLPSLMLHVELVTLWDLIRSRLGIDPAEGIPLFKGMSRTQVRSILLAKPFKMFDAGEVLFRKGEPSDSMYALVSGEMEVINPLSEDPSHPSFGSYKRINTLRAGDVLGEMGLMRSAPRSATVMATKPGELLQINWKMIERLHWLYPPISQKFCHNLMVILCNRIDRLTCNLTDECLLNLTVSYYPRELFLDMLTREIDRARRYCEDLSLGLITIVSDDTDAKRADDTAEQLYIGLSEIITRTIRKSDILGRWDLRTLAIALPHTTTEDANVLCERLCQVIQDNSTRLSAAPVKLKCHIAGLADHVGCSSVDLINGAFESLQQTSLPAADR